MFKCTNIFIYVCNIIDTWRCTCIFVLNLVYMKYMQQRSSPVRLYVNMKYCRVLDSQKQWLLFACLLNLLNSCRHFLECLTAQCPRSRDNWYDIDQAVWRGYVDSCLGFIHMQYTVNIWYTYQKNRYIVNKFLYNYMCIDRVGALLYYRSRIIIIMCIARIS